ncbi:btaf1 RNA polymerase II, B-TFIID transcription factor-associated, 170kDa [Stylosanthes scabra]|uniref:Btaf1 RNA polymerase II, B-TFIID transcription factor-associated, 170kDa n=1 Tax=Stylosanthes scabra TaxID=79078 RepID=A0ABU6YZ74_9FABA|nr:btaf1 RNA polymerase II, B-TFIID transcription factor-associated, 170kDa [Stylosanthes scabra]
MWKLGVWAWLETLKRLRHGLVCFNFDQVSLGRVFDGSSLGRIRRGQAWKDGEVADPCLGENESHLGHVITWSKCDHGECLASSLACLVLVACHVWAMLNNMAQTFGDYVSDQVVAPVRETCAEAIGATFKYMHLALVNETLNILLKMQTRMRDSSWKSSRYQIFGCCAAVGASGLEDPDDDVRAIAAYALIPAVAAIVALQGPTLRPVVMFDA